MAKERVRVEQFDELFNPETTATPIDRKKIHDKVRFIVEEYPALQEKYRILEEKFEEAQAKAGMYEQMKRTLKLQS